MTKLWRRFYFFLHRSRFERELADEMDTHREMMPPDRRSQFGNTTRLIGFAAGLGCFILAAALATLSPAVRALRIDPCETLRAE